MSDIMIQFTRQLNIVKHKCIAVKSKNHGNDRTYNQMCACVFIRMHGLLLFLEVFKNCGMIGYNAESKLRWSSGTRPFFKRQAIIIPMIY